MEAICEILCRLGITANYIGFFQVSYAVCLVIEEPRRLLQVTRRLYPEVAAYYGVTWGSVERNIRTVAELAWEGNRPYLEELARRPLRYKPRASEFLAILTSRFPFSEKHFHKNLLPHAFLPADGLGQAVALLCLFVLSANQFISLFLGLTFNS